MGWGKKISNWLFGKKEFSPIVKPPTDHNPTEGEQAKTQDYFNELLARAHKGEQEHAESITVKIPQLHSAKWVSKEKKERIDTGGYDSEMYLEVNVEDADDCYILIVMTGYQYWKEEIKAKIVKAGAPKTPFRKQVIYISVTPQENWLTSAKITENNIKTEVYLVSPESLIGGTEYHKFIANYSKNEYANYLAKEVIHRKDIKINFHTTFFPLPIRIHSLCIIAETKLLKVILAPWMEIAYAEEGVYEEDYTYGFDRVKEYYKDGAGQNLHPINVPWCASFANWVLVETNKTKKLNYSYIPLDSHTHNPAMAANFVNPDRYVGGLVIASNKKPPFGSILIIKHKNKDNGHATFVVGYEVTSNGFDIIGFGGNQTHRVQRERYSFTKKGNEYYYNTNFKLLGYVLPQEYVYHEHIDKYYKYEENTDVADAGSMV